MKRVDELETAPVVGKFYLVPCVIEVLDNGKSRGYLPVINNWHEDADIIGFKPHHYHYDVRFFRKADWADEYSAKQNPEQLARVYADWNRHMTVGDESPEPIVYRVMKCQREMPDFPLEIRGAQAAWRRRLEKDYERANVKSCRTCPHRGFKLGGLPQKNGVVVCNGHGLAWNLETGELVSRL